MAYRPILAKRCSWLRSTEMDSVHRSPMQRSSKLQSGSTDRTKLICHDKTWRVTSVYFFTNSITWNSSQDWLSINLGIRIDFPLTFPWNINASFIGLVCFEHNDAWEAHSVIQKSFPSANADGWCKSRTWPPIDQVVVHRTPDSLRIHSTVLFVYFSSVHFRSPVAPRYQCVFSWISKIEWVA